MKAETSESLNIRRRLFTVFNQKRSHEPEQDACCDRKNQKRTLSKSNDEAVALSSSKTRAKIEIDDETASR